jgi:hypothetical protein
MRNLLQSLGSCSWVATSPGDNLSKNDGSPKHWGVGIIGGCSTGGRSGCPAALVILRRYNPLLFNCNSTKKAGGHCFPSPTLPSKASAARGVVSYGRME